MTTTYCGHDRPADYQPRHRRARRHPLAALTALIALVRVTR